MCYVEKWICETAQQLGFAGALFFLESTRVHVLVIPRKLGCLPWTVKERRREGKGVVWWIDPSTLDLVHYYHDTLVVLTVSLLVRLLPGLPRLLPV